MMTDSFTQLTLPPKASSCSILFAFSQTDREMFLPGRNLEEEFGAKARWIDTSKIDKDEWEHLLYEASPEILVTAWDTPALSESFALESNLALRYVCHMCGGVRTRVPRNLLARGVLVSNWGTAISHTIAEQAILLTLGALRNLPLWGSFMQLPATRIFQLRTQSLRGRRVGLHGFGGIAREIVEMLKPFRVDISAYSAGVPRELFEHHGVRPCESLEELFSHNNVLIECEALTPVTRGSVTGPLLDLLPQDAVFVNVGRGAVVDEQALIRCAAQGRIRIAVDVYAQEPPALDSGLFRIPNALLSPHIAGPTSDTLPLCGEFAMSNLHKFLQGESVDGVVTLEAYDRSP